VLPKVKFEKIAHAAEHLRDAGKTVAPFLLPLQSLQDVTRPGRYAARWLLWGEVTEALGRHCMELGKLKELASTSLFDLLLFLYQEDVLLSSLDMSNFFSFLLCLPVDGFFQVGENQSRAHASPWSMLLKSFVYVPKVKR